MLMRRLCVCAKREAGSCRRSGAWNSTRKGGERRLGGCKACGPGVGAIPWDTTPPAFLPFLLPLLQTLGPSLTFPHARLCPAPGPLQERITVCPAVPKAPSSVSASYRPTFPTLFKIARSFSASFISTIELHHSKPRPRGQAPLKVPRSEWINSG